MDAQTQALLAHLQRQLNTLQQQERRLFQRIDKLEQELADMEARIDRLEQLVNVERETA